MALNIIASQVGSDVIFSGTGSLKTGSMSPEQGGSEGGGLIGTISGAFPCYLQFPTSDLTLVRLFYNTSSSFSTFGTQYASSIQMDGGDGFGINPVNDYLELPSGYIDDSPLNISMIFTGSTMTSLGLSAGTYTYAWGTGDSADSIVLLIEPEPSPTPTPTKTSTPTPTPTKTSTPTPTPTNTQTPTVTSTNTPTPSITPSVTPTNTQTPTVTPTKTSTPTPTPTNTQTPTVTSTNTPTPSITPSITPTNTRTPTPTPSITPSVTPTLTPSPTPFGVLDVNVQYDYTNEIFGSFSGGSWEAQYGNVPHPINYDPSRRLTVIDLSSITIGGQNGLNN